MAGRLVEWCFRDGEAEDERFRKTVIVVIVYTMVFRCFLAFATIGVHIYQITPIVSLIIAVAVLLYMRITRSCTRALTEGVIMWVALEIVFIADYRNYGVYQTWPVGVIIMDLLLLCNCRDVVVNLLRNMIIVYLIYRTVDDSITLSYYDHLPQLGYADRPSDDCKLGVSVGVHVLAGRLVSFVCDFYMTRGFAKTLRKEQTTMRASVALAQCVAEALVQFDLDGANAVLVESEEGPLKEAFAQLLDNLRSYRPYLPDALFAMKDSPLLFTGDLAPPQGKVAVVFTDIQSSTSLWETVPSGMRKAISTHNTVMRECLALHQGYEVKTIGDAFMAVFSTAQQACNFALSAQEALYHSEWSDDLMQAPLCERRDGLWNGLRVRIGINVGDADMQLNPVTGRADYFGPTVNTAARVEGVALGGTVAVTDVVMTEIQAKNIAVRQLGGQSLKGVGQEVMVYLLAPPQLERRLWESKEPPPVRRVSVTSASDSSMSTLTPLHPQKRVASGRFGMVTGTVVHTRVDYSTLASLPPSCHHDHVNRGVAAVLDSVERTGGVLLTVASSSLVAGWNLGGSPVYSHATQAVMCVGLLFRGVSEEPSPHAMTVGIATGSMMRGRVGTQSQMFVVTIGRCLELAGELAVAACSLSTFALLCAMPGQRCIADDPRCKQLVVQLGSWGAADVYLLRVREIQAWAKGGYKDRAEDAVQTDLSPALSVVEMETDPVQGDLPTIRTGVPESYDPPPQ